MSDCLVIGGGVIGLSLAYELAGHGLKVRVIEARQPGREASWAGAGILPPASAYADDPLERLTALSNRWHAEWAERFLAELQIDNGFRRCGALYLARDAAEARNLEQLAAWAAARKIQAERLTIDELRECEACLVPRGELLAAYLVPGECQLRNPRHLKALIAACAARGVEIIAGTTAYDFEIRGERVRGVHTGSGTLRAEQVCITTGSWTQALARQLGFTPAIKPIRGQMLLLAHRPDLLLRIVNEGSRYLVPRFDGRTLVGSTEEDAGFDATNTVSATRELLDFALSLVPDLAAAQLERSWAGLRPSTEDGLPYLGRVPGLDNAFLAAGHFRSGLQLSTGTAVVMSQLMLGKPLAQDLHIFRLDRHAASSGQQPRAVSLHGTA